MKKIAPFKKAVPGQIKKPRSPYFMFLAENRAGVVAENPTLGMFGTTKVLAAVWNSMSKEEKAEYEETAAKDRVRYNRQINGYAYEESEPEDVTETPSAPVQVPTQAQNRQKSPSPPPRAPIEAPVPTFPANAFNVFLYKRGKEVIEANPRISQIQFDDQLKKEWTSTTEQAKENYSELARRFNIKFGNDQNTLVVTKWRVAVDE